jgi:hypothetical protein
MPYLMILLALSLNALAQSVNVSFTYFGNEGNRQSYYACSYVENQAEKYLELLGATDIDVQCFGGINPSWVAPVSLDASFEVPQLSGSEGEIVEIKGDHWNPSCGINVRMIREFLKKFPHVKVLKKDDHCAFSSSNYYYQLEIPR